MTRTKAKLMHRQTRLSRPPRKGTLSGFRKYLNHWKHMTVEEKLPKLTAFSEKLDLCFKSNISLQKKRVTFRRYFSDRIKKPLDLHKKLASLIDHDKSYLE